VEITLRLLDFVGRCTEVGATKSFAAAEVLLRGWERDNGDQDCYVEILLEPGFMITLQVPVCCTLKDRVLEMLQERLAQRARDRAHAETIQRLQREIALVSTAQ